MNHLALKVLAVICFSLAATTWAGQVTVDPAGSVIVLSQGDIPSHADAARELQKHLQLITSQAIPVVEEGETLDGRYPFHIALQAPTDAKPIEAQQSRWNITAEAAYFYGDISGAKTGAEFAVYSFLEDQLGVVWIEPGDEGIVYKKMNPLVLRAGEFDWTPKLMFRKIRQGGARIAKKMPAVSKTYSDYADFQATLESHNAFAQDVMQWQKRMRMGGRRPGGGHAFYKWWDQYGESHPEYFALNKYGKREPVPLPKAHQTNEFVKICPSNPGVAKQIIKDWLPKKSRVTVVDTGMNDGIDNFCECEDCRALDVSAEGEKAFTHLTDRYVHMTNAVAREAASHRADAEVAMYAYLTTLYPPRELKVEPNVVVQVVPYVIPLEEGVTQEVLGGWYEAGATKLAFRPNYHTKYMTTAMPLGVEQQMFNVFQLALKNGCVSADYDSLTNNWPVTGMTDYILARAMSDPDKPFSYWEDQYCSAFGDASEHVKQYYRYWRTSLWEQRLLPKIQAICNKGGAGDFSRGLLWSLDDYYTLEDFDKAAALLEQAAAQEISTEERQRVNELMLANKHARLMYQAIAAEPMNKSDHASELVAFRQQHKSDLKLQWLGVFAFEIGNGDLAGYQIAEEMAGYMKPWLPTDLHWRFKMDASDEGLERKWQESAWQQTADWELFRTDRFWERQFNFDETNTLSEATSRAISDYNGIGWYTTQIEIPADWADRNIFLRFGAVDESCWVYVNGKPAGEHLFVHKNDWKTPFEIQIDDVVDWDAEKQTVTVRVEDTSGAGGIWRPVWIVSKK